MKKRFFSILAFATLMSITVCTPSCSNDDEDEPVQKNQQNASQEAAVNISSNMLDYVAAKKSGADESIALECLNNINKQVQSVVAQGNAEVLSQAEGFVAEATGLDEATVSSIFSNTEGTSGIAAIIDNLSSQEQADIVTNASEYIKGYGDAKELANAYENLSNNSSTKEEKEAALDNLEKTIKENYQASENANYKSTYVKAAAIAVGLSQPLTKEILDSENPKAAAMLAFGITLEGGESAAQGVKDADEAAKVLESLKGKTLGEIINDTALIQQIGTYKEAYRNGSDEYKEAFKQELKAQGTSAALIDMFDSEEDVDVSTIMALLGISY